MKDTKTLMHRLGEIIAATVAICLTVCVCAILVSLTLGFLRLIF